MQCIHNVPKLSLCCSIKLKPFLHKKNKYIFGSLTNNAVYFYHSFLNANLHRCYAAIIVIFWCKKNGIFTLIKWDIKTRWRCLKMAEIEFPRTWNFKIFREGCSQIPDPRSQIYKAAALFHRTPYDKTWIRPRASSFTILCQQSW